MWGIIPAAGVGSRIQPLGFSKELLPVGSRSEEGNDKPKAVAEYLVDRFIRAGVDIFCFVVAPGKSDIMEFFGADRLIKQCATFVVQPQPAGLCDAIFRVAPLIPPEELVVIGLPDTIWFPENGLCTLPDHYLSFLLFPVKNPELFDVVRTDDLNTVIEIQVKPCEPRSKWIWGAIKMPGSIFHELHALWKARHEADEYIGTLINAWLAQGGQAKGYYTGNSYVDVGTINGYHEAIRILNDHKKGPALS